MESHSSIKSSQYKDFMNQMKGLYKAFNKNIEDPSNT